MAARSAQVRPCPQNRTLGCRPARPQREATFGNQPELEQLAVDAWRRQCGFSMLIRRINTRSSVSIRGRPPEDRDFQRQ